MGEIGLYSVGFYVWWIFLNGFLCFLKCCFTEPYRSQEESACAGFALCQLRNYLSGHVSAKFWDEQITPAYRSNFLLCSIFYEA